MSAPRAMADRKDLMPVMYIPHGGGPLPLLGEPRHRELIDFLKEVPKHLPKPKAVVIISAHWESDVVRVSASPQPGMIYDYGGFPPETYEYSYPAPGDPALAETVLQLLSTQHIESVPDSRRGFDHGTFVPLMLMYPEADIPVVQVSLLRSLNPEKHIALGEALAPLRQQGVLILGSGMSFHNQHATLEQSTAFDDWLTEALVAAPMAEAKRRLQAWQLAPSALVAHAREEHLLPAHVCLGAASMASTGAEKVFSGDLFNLRIAGFLWR